LAYQTLRFAGRQGSLEAWTVFHPSSPKTAASKPQTIVLMFHGYASCKSALLPEAKIFYDLGYDPILVDFGCHGGSEGTRTTLGYYESEDVDASWMVAHQRWPEAKFIFYGVSMGAVAVMRAVSEYHLLPAAAVLESPFSGLLTTTRNRFWLMGVPPFPCAELMVFWGGVRCRFDGFKFNPVDYAPMMACPTLLMVGEKDRRVTVEETKEICNRLPGVRRMAVMEGAGHESFAKRDPEKWSGEVDGFLKSIQ